MPLPGHPRQVAPRQYLATTKPKNIKTVAVILPRTEPTRSPPAEPAPPLTLPASVPPINIARDAELPRTYNVMSRGNLRGFSFVLKLRPQPHEN
jgi:hypothetical protein